MKKIKNTKIVATVSDRRCDVEFIKGLWERGVNVIRLNTAHQSLEDSLRVVQNIRAVSEDIPILIDTKGPEMRITKADSDIYVQKGELINVTGSSEKISTRECIYINYENFEADIPLETSILIDDGELELVVNEKKEGKLICEVKNDGVIKSRKSVNVPGVHIRLPSLSEKDKTYIEFAMEHNIDFIAHSFVRNKEDVLAIKNVLDFHSSPVKIIAKIENQMGVDNIDEILDYAYGVMVARGDLGIEVAAERIPGIARKLVQRCKSRKKPVIIATQMLHSMINNPRPTRAEVSDIANAIYIQTDAIMLSGETASGDYPNEAVETMNRIAIEVEASQEVQNQLRLASVDNQIGMFLAESAFKASQELQVKAIILDTLTGRTARYMAAYHGNIPVYGFCYNKEIMRQLALSYGIIPEFLSQRITTDDFKIEAVKTLLEKGAIAKDDLVVILAGSFGPRHGATFVEIDRVRNILKLEDQYSH